MFELAMSTLAAATPESSNLAIFGAAISCGIVIVGAAMGIGTIGSKAVDAIARQPEAGGRIFQTMIVSAAMIEGVTFFALIVCFLTVSWMRG